MSGDQNARLLLAIGACCNLAMIRDTIEYLRSQGRKVIYDAEHWFDGYKQNPEYAILTLSTALNAAR